jgi:hypothetical protein
MGALHGYLGDAPASSVRSPALEAPRSVAFGRPPLGGAVHLAGRLAVVTPGTRLSAQLSRIGHWGELHAALGALAWLGGPDGRVHLAQVDGCRSRASASTQARRQHRRQRGKHGTDPRPAGQQCHARSSLLGRALGARNRVRTCVRSGATANGKAELRGARDLRGAEAGRGVRPGTTMAAGWPYMGSARGATARATANRPAQQASASSSSRTLPQWRGPHTSRP